MTARHKKRKGSKGIQVIKADMSKDRGNDERKAGRTKGAVSVKSSRNLFTRNIIMVTRESPQESSGSGVSITYQGEMEGRKEWTTLVNHAGTVATRRGQWKQEHRNNITLERERIE